MPKQPTDTRGKPQLKRQKRSFGTVKSGGSEALYDALNDALKEKVLEPKEKKGLSLRLKRERTKPVFSNGVVLMIPCDFGQEHDEQRSDIVQLVHADKEQNSVKYQVRIAPADLITGNEGSARKLTGLNEMCSFLQESTSSIRKSREESENRAIEQHRSFIEQYAHMCDSFGDACS